MENNIKKKIYKKWSGALVVDEGTSISDFMGTVSATCAFRIFMYFFCVCGVFFVFFLVETYLMSNVMRRISNLTFLYPRINGQYCGLEETKFDCYASSNFHNLPPVTWESH